MSTKRYFENAVVFDYGGVLTTSPREALATWAESAQVDRQSFNTVMQSWMSSTATADNPVHLLERGEMSGEEFNTAFGSQLFTTSGKPIMTANYLEQIFDLVQPEPTMHDMLRTLHQHDIGIALLSNSWDNKYPHELLDIFDAVVLSGDTGLRKPDPEIFRLTLDKLGIGAEQAIMVDDNRHNIVAAQKLGMAGILHKNPVQTIQQLNEMLLDTWASKFSTYEQGETYD